MQRSDAGISLKQGGGTNFIPRSAEFYEIHAVCMKLSEVKQLCWLTG